MTASLRSLLIMAILTLGIMQLADADVPKTLTYQGLLTDGAGQPVTDTLAITLRLFAAETDGTALWTETDNFAVIDGRFSAVLGGKSGSPLPAASTLTGDTWIEVQVGANAPMPRQKLTSVAYALRAAHADNAPAPIPTGVIVMWSGEVNGVPSGWALCNGSNGTPDLRDRFIVGAGLAYDKGARGGENYHSLILSELPAHNHGGNTGVESAPHTHYDSGHAHTGWIVSVNKDGTSNARAREALNDGPTGGIAFVTDGGYANLGTQSANHTHSISAQGEGNAHENRPPYFALAFIMKL